MQLYEVASAFPQRVAIRVFFQEGIGFAEVGRQVGRTVLEDSVVVEADYGIPPVQRKVAFEGRESTDLLIWILEDLSLKKRIASPSRQATKVV